MSLVEAITVEALLAGRHARHRFPVSASVDDPLDAAGDCLILPFFETRRLQGIGQDADERANGYLGAALERTARVGRVGETLALLDVPGIAAAQVILVGCGRRRDIDADRFRQIAGHAAKVIVDSSVATVIDTLSLIKVKRRDTSWRLRQLTEALAGERYKLEAFTTNAASDGKRELSVCHVVRDEARVAPALGALREAQAIAIGSAFARDIGNLPPNVCTPPRLVEEAVALADRHPSLACEILDENALGRFAMGALLSVAAGSAEPARLIVLRHRGSKDADSRPAVLLGKGITFDSGGLSIKTSASMENMKYDLCGAAAVLGAMEATATLDLPIDVVGVIAAAENMPGRGATRPGDVVQTMSGQTVEILNTDAEGRLVLCDAISWCKQELEPAVLIDVATLTGACVTALGQHLHGLFGNRKSLIRGLVKAGERAADAPWPMPLGDAYQRSLDSRIADMRNIGGRSAGAITAACFLERFAEGVPWAHLDIAGTATDAESKGATGRPVPLLVQFLIDRARKL